MRLAKVSVKQLFGVFNHEISLNDTARVRIIHGPNGFGKTVMLRMIAALAEGATGVFEHTPFEEFSATFEDGTVAIVRRRVDPVGGAKSASLDFVIRAADGGETNAPGASFPRSIPSAYLKQVDTMIPGPFRLRGRQWVDSDGMEYSLAEMVERFPRAVEDAA